MSTKLALTSDLHGLILPEVPVCDVAIYAGDLCPDNVYTCRARHNCASVQAKWLRDVFVPYLSQQLQRAGQIICIFGNHDFVGEFPNLWPTWPTGVHVLSDTAITLNGVKYYGSPWVPNLPMWALGKREEHLAQAFAEIPTDTDVLVTHGPPYGLLDRVIGWPTGVGSTSLAWERHRIRPKVHVWGHIHESYGYAQTPDGVCYNVSAVTETYTPRATSFVEVTLG